MHEYVCVCASADPIVAIQQSLIFLDILHDVIIFFVVFLSYSADWWSWEAVTDEDLRSHKCNRWSGNVCRECVWVSM